ncbi:hypothetical protein Hdeb2414_s0014g00426001 [Helianthus debilis subsp. tardiflorus]
MFKGFGHLKRINTIDGHNIIARRLERFLDSSSVVSPMSLVKPAPLRFLSSLYSFRFGKYDVSNMIRICKLSLPLGIRLKKSSSPRSSGVVIESGGIGGQFATPNCDICLP